jgi:hypothetical protein
MSRKILALAVTMTRFLSFLPRIEAHARVGFRDIRCPDIRADRIAETIALAWKWFLRLEERGQDATKFVSAIATYAVKAVRSGRRVAGMARSKDVMNPITQRRYGFAVEKLPESSTSTGNSLTEALVDNTVTPPPDAAAFRVDFPRWLKTLPDRDQRLARELMVGERPLGAARRFKMSPARVSQVRRELCQDWARVHGEGVGAIA